MLALPRTTVMTLEARRQDRDLRAESCEGNLKRRFFAYEFLRRQK
jgi:hypothetical protein